MRLMLFVLALVTACAARTYPPVTPLQRELVARYLAGESLDVLAKERTNGDRTSAYHLVHETMTALQRQLQRDR
ncbi:MAG TPA: hypothetical protein VF403_19385 [Kofleriaceae bacterium]